MKVIGIVYAFLLFCFGCVYIHYSKVDAQYRNVIDPPLTRVIA